MHSDATSIRHLLKYLVLYFYASLHFPLLHPGPLTHPFQVDGITYQIMKRWNLRPRAYAYVLCIVIPPIPDASLNLSERVGASAGFTQEGQREFVTRSFAGKSMLGLLAACMIWIAISLQTFGRITMYSATVSIK